MEILHIEDINKSFGGLQALNQVSLTAEQGLITVLIGPNGAGKTTLLNVLSGLDKANSGKILFKDQNILGLPPHEIAQKGIGRTFQILKGFQQLTVAENVMIGRHVKTKSGLWNCLFSLPSARIEDKQAYKYAIDLLEVFHLTPYRDKTLGQLPHGIQRLVELARALASEPSLLLLDEPAFGLTPREGEMLPQALRAIQSRGVSIFLIEHNMRLVMGIADKVVVLSFGQKIAEGSAKEISKNQAVITAYLGRGISAITA